MHRDFQRIVIIGRGRLGSALAPALGAAGFSVTGPFGRGDALPPVGEADAVLLCVPDGAIADVAATLPQTVPVGHCSGAQTLDVLAAADAFSIHPLLSVIPGRTQFRGAACAIAGRSARALACARALAEALGMEAIVVPDDKRALYHAAASIASNYLVTLEDAAEQAASAVGLERRHLARLAQSALDNWATLGGRGALTGPIARGDEATVRRQREAIAETTPRLLPLWDALATATRALAEPMAAPES